MRVRLLVTFVVLPVLLWAALPLVSSGETTQQNLDHIKSQIDKTQHKIGRKKGAEQVLTTDITAFSHRIAALQGRISTLQRRQVALQTDLDHKRASLSQVQTDLRGERARLVRLRRRLGVAREALAQRLVDLYKADRPDLVTVVLSSHGFADLLERGEFLRRISESDARILDAVRTAKADSERTAARLADLERRQKAVAAQVLAKTQEVAQVKDDLIGTRDGYARTRERKRHVLGRVRDQRQNLEGHLTALRAEQQKVQAKLAAVANSGSAGTLPAGAIRQGSGGLIWPVNGPITSPFCESRSWESCHPGIDIGVPSGTPIRAAAAGTVVLIQSEAASGGYGNFTCIQHTSTMSTCYAHQQSFAVSMGEHVAQGQVIGYSDCTGRCFGPHLHFEVRINGAVTNPLNYL